MQSNETWRTVPGYEGHYEVSIDGRVRSLDRQILRADGKPLTVRGRIMKTAVSGRGYSRLTLVKDGVQWRAGVHQVVARAWLPAPRRRIGARRGEFVVNHKDGNKLNNHATNLEYITADANVRHARAAGVLSAKGAKNNKAKLTEDDVRAIRERYSLGEVQTSLAAAFKVNQTTISLIVRRKGWEHVP